MSPANMSAGLFLGAQIYVTDRAQTLLKSAREK